MANIGRGGYDPTGANAKVLARIKKKKKKGLISQEDYNTAVVSGPSTPSAGPRNAPKPQEPSIPGQPRGDIGHTPGAMDPKIVSANVKNLTAAYYAKWHRFPTSAQTYAMLQGTSQLWTVNQWWEMFKPLKARNEKPAIKDYEKLVLSKPKGPKSAGIDLEVDFEGQGPLGFWTNDDILDDAPSLFGKSWAWAEGDNAAGNRKTPTPDFVQLPRMLKMLDKDVRVGLSGMSKAEQDYYKLSSSGIIAWKKYLAAIKKKNGEKFGFDPNSAGWSPELDKEYHKYLFSRVAPYAILSKDVAVQEKANKLIRELYPKIFGEEGLDLTGVSTEKSVMGLVNIGAVLKNGGVPDRNILEFCYNNFVDGRVPGQSEKKAMYDFVEEFGAQYLPANKFKEYNDSVYTIGKVIAKPFEWMTDAAEWSGEATDWLFDEWKDNPGAWGHVGEGLHFLYNGAFTELNPMTSKIQANVFTAGTTAITAGIDMLMDLSPGKAQKKDLEAAYTQWESQGRMLNVLKQKTKGEEAKAEVQKQIEEWKAREPDNPEWFDKERSMKDLLSWKAWTEQYNENLGKMPYGTVFNEIETELGYAGWNWLDQDRFASKALDYVYLAADMYAICKAGAKSDAFAKSAAIKGALKGFSGLRKLEKFAMPGRMSKAAAEAAKIDFGVDPTNPQAAKPARQKYPAGTVIDGVKVGGRWMPTEKGPAPRQHHIPFAGRNPELGGEVGPTHGRLGGGRVGRPTFRGGKDMGALREDAFMNWATYDEGYAQIYGEAGDRTAGIGRYRVNPAAKVYRYLGADDKYGFPDLMELAEEYAAQGAGRKSIVLAKKVLAAMAREKGFDVVEIFDYKPRAWRGNENEIMIVNRNAVRRTGERGIWGEFGPEATAGERIGQGPFPQPRTERGKFDAAEPHEASGKPMDLPPDLIEKFADTFLDSGKVPAALVAFLKKNYGLTQRQAAYAKRLIEERVHNLRNDPKRKISKYNPDERAAEDLLLGIEKADRADMEASAGGRTDSELADVADTVFDGQHEIANDGSIGYRGRPVGDDPAKFSEIKKILDEQERLLTQSLDVKPGDVQHKAYNEALDALERDYQRLIGNGDTAFDPTPETVPPEWNTRGTETFPEDWADGGYRGPWAERDAPSYRAEDITAQHKKARNAIQALERKFYEATSPEEMDQIAFEVLSHARRGEDIGDPLFRGLAREIESWDEYEKGLYGSDISNLQGAAMEVFDAIVDEESGMTTAKRWTQGDREQAAELLDELPTQHFDEWQKVFDDAGISERVQRMIRRAIGGKWGPEDEAGFREMVHTSDEFDMNEVRGRHTADPVEPEVGQLMAFFRGERRYIADKLSEAQARGETGDHIRIWEEEIAVIDAQWKTLAHLRGGGLNAMIGRMLEIDAQITRLAARGDKDSIAQIDELLAEKHELASDPKTMDDVVTLGGDWSAAQYGDTVGGHVVPYKHDDLNARAPRKKGEGAQELGQQADLTRPPSTPRAGRRKDYDHLKEPRMLEDMTIDEWNRIIDFGEVIDGHDAMDLLQSKGDGVVLKDGTITWNKDTPEFKQAEIDAAAGRPVNSRAKKNKEDAAKRPKEEPEVTPKPSVAVEETREQYNARIEAEQAKAAETPVEEVQIPKESAGLEQENAAPTAEEGAGTTKGSEPGKTPPKRPAKRPTADPGDLPPNDPQYVHSKLLLTVAEYIAQFTKAGDYSDPLIARLLGLIDQPEVNAQLIKDLQACNNSEQVLRKLANAYDAKLIQVDPAGPAIFKLAKAQAREKFIDAATKMGPLGQPLIEAYRIIGTTTQTDSTIDAEGSPIAVRNVGHATKLGMAKMTPEVAQRINYYEAKMMRATTASARRKIVHEFEEEIKRNMGEEKWAKFKEYEGSILHARASTWLAITRPEEKGAYTDPKKRAYGRDSVPPARKELDANRNHLIALKKSAEERGDIEKAAHYQDAIEAADSAFARYDKACKDYVDLSKKSKLTPAEKKRLNAANQVLNDMGTEQPVWAHQRTNRINFSINPRILAWYQAGRSWRNYEKFDTLFMEKPIRLWKQWAMFGFGFPLRVYAGDEFWRIPLEGISLKQAREALAMTKRLRGQLSRSERKLFNKLDEKPFKELTDAEKTKLRELEKKMTPELSEYELRSLNDREDFDWANDPSDSFEIISPRRVEYTDADGNVQVRHEIPDEPLYLPAIKHVIQKLGDNPTIHELFKETPPEGGWTIDTVKETLLRIAGENSARGRVIRQFLYDTDRITLKQLGEEGLAPKAFKQAMGTESAGAYRNVDNVFGEWADVFVKLSRNEELLEGVKNRHISIRTLSRINPEDLFPVPIKRRILSSNGLPDVPILNLPSKIYNGVKLPGTEFDVGTLPMLTFIGTKVRDILWGTEYKRQLDIELKAAAKTTPGYHKMTIVERRHIDNEASKRAAQRAAHFVEKTTYVRDATVFEDMVRNALPFINSYRQFMVYWGKKMVTRPFTMGAVWSLTPNLPTTTELGPFQMFLSSFAPFFLQPEFDDEDGERDKTPGGLAKAIFQEPSLNPIYTAAIGFLLRESTGTKAEIAKLPFMGGASNSLAPLGKAGGIVEGLVGTPEMLQVGGPVPIFKDDTSSHAMLLSMVGAGTKAPDGSMGEQPLKESLPFPLNIVTAAGVHNPNQLIQSAFGLGPVSAKMIDPIAQDYLDEKIKYNKLLTEGKEKEAATYLGSTKYLSIMKMIETSSNPEEMMQLKQDHPWAVRLSVGLYNWNSQGDIVFSPDWAKDAKDLDVYRKDLRDEYLQIWGGVPLDTDGRPLAEQAYGGDINRAKAIPKMEKHLKEIEEYAKQVAMEVAGGDKEFAKSLMDEFHKKCDNDQYVDKYTQVPVLPSWYENALKRDNKDPKLWHPNFYQETVLGLYGNDFKGGNWEPSEEETKAMLQMQKEGLLSPRIVEQLTGDFSKWGSVAQEREEGLKDTWRKHYLYLAEEEWYDLDAKTLNRIGFNVSKKIDPVLLDVRAAYYKYKAVGDEYGTSSREYRDARNKFYAYKDKKFLSVPGGEIFVGGLPSRLLKTPFIVGANFRFTGEDAKEQNALWLRYRKECEKAKPDLKVIRELKTHFNGQLDDKIAAWNAQNTWYAVIGTAQYMRHVMKTSWSDYYEGPGNSVYTNMGKKMVKSLENMAKEYMQRDYGDEENYFKTDINKYFGTPHELAYKMLEWYMH